MNYDFLLDKNILITGGTGSLGRELVREVLKHDSKVVRIFNVDETEQFEFHHELREYEDTVRRHPQPWTICTRARYGILM